MRFYYALLFLILHSVMIAQNLGKRDSIFARTIDILNVKYKDFQQKGKYVYAITEDDSLVVFNIKSHKVKYVKKDVVSVAKNSHGKIYYATNENELVGFDSERRKIEGAFITYKLLFDRENEPLLITDRGLFYKNQFYEPNNIIPNYRYYEQISKLPRKKGRFKNPDLVYVDKKSRLWLTYDKGEFGADVLFFDLGKKEFFEDNYLTIDVDYNIWENRERYFKDLYERHPDKIKITASDTLFKFPNQLPIIDPVRGIIEKEDKIFISQSLFHFSVSSSFNYIGGFDREGFYKSVDIGQDLLGYRYIDGIPLDEEYLGPLSYNNFNDFIYYYSSKGFFRLIEKGEKFEKEFVFKPWIVWSATNRNNIGADINVIKFEFRSAREIIFLTTNSGIGYYNGKEVIYFR